MAASRPVSVSMKEYLKRYETEEEEKSKKKKTKKKKKAAEKLDVGVVVVDEDPVWQKPVQIPEEEDSPDETPQVEEDIDVKRMRRLEVLRARRPFHEISQDGSGWVSVADIANRSSACDADQDTDISPPRKQKPRSDTPSPGGRNSSLSHGQQTQFDISSPTDRDISPPRKPRARFDTPSPRDEDISPPRKRKAIIDTPSPRAEDMSPPRKRRAQIEAPVSRDGDISPPRKENTQRDSSDLSNVDISPPRKQRARFDTSIAKDEDISPPRKQKEQFDSRSELGGSYKGDMSPPRRRGHGSAIRSNWDTDLSPPRKNKKDPEDKFSRGSRELDLSPPRKTKEQPKTGLVTGREMKEEITKIKEIDQSRFRDMDPTISGRGAETVYRDKLKGVQISKEEYLKSRKKGKKEEKPKEEKKLEWGKGLAQKREAEAAQLELELEKEKPFARYRDDPDLDSMLKDRVRFGDPMAHLVKRKHFGPALQDLGSDEKMKESGFIIPQDIPMHSWIKRGLEAAPNRYGIKPGRHWDGVDRSSGYEKELFKRMNEKKATETEAYLWSVADM